MCCRGSYRWCVYKKTMSSIQSVIRYRIQNHLQKSIQKKCWSNIATTLQRTSCPHKPRCNKILYKLPLNAGNELDLHVSQQSQNNDHQMHLFLCVDCSLPHIGLIFYRKRPGNKVSRMRRPGYFSIRVAWAAYKKIWIIVG